MYMHIHTHSSHFVWRSFYLLVCLCSWLECVDVHGRILESTVYNVSSNALHNYSAPALTLLCTPFSLSQAYQERSKYISDQLSALKTQMDDLKMEDRMTRNDLLHEESIRLGNNKRLALDKV